MLVKYIRDYIITQPYHLLDKTRALVAGVKLCSSCHLVDRPYVKESIIRGPQTSQVSLIRAESGGFDAICMLVQDGKRSIGRILL